jgi:hypothetical protein
LDHGADCGVCDIDAGDIFDIKTCGILFGTFFGL